MEQKLEADHPGGRIVREDRVTPDLAPLVILLGYMFTELLLVLGILDPLLFELVDGPAAFVTSVTGRTELAVGVLTSGEVGFVKGFVHGIAELNVEPLIINLPLDLIEDAPVDRRERLSGDDLVLGIRLVDDVHARQVLAPLDLVAQPEILLFVLFLVRIHVVRSGDRDDVMSSGVDGLVERLPRADDLALGCKPCRFLLVLLSHDHPGRGRAFGELAWCVCAFDNEFGCSRGFERCSVE